MLPFGSWRSLRPFRIAAALGTAFAALASCSSPGPESMSCVLTDVACVCSVRQDANDVACNKQSFPPDGSLGQCKPVGTGHCCQSTKNSVCTCGAPACSADDTEVADCSVANVVCSALTSVNVSETLAAATCRGDTKTSPPAICCSDHAWPNDGTCSCQPYRCFTEKDGSCRCSVGLDEPGAVIPSTTTGGGGSLCDPSWCFGTTTYCDEFDYCSFCDYECLGDYCQAVCN